MTVEVGGRAYLVGEAGDQTLVGDWDCDGERTLGLYRPSTGEVFIFDAWPEGAALSSAPPHQTGVRGGRAVVVGDGPCQRVEIAGSGPP